MSEKKSELLKAETISDIFCFLTTECASFLNYEIFQNIHEHYSIGAEQEKLKYPQHLEAYVEKHKISEIAKIIPKLPMPKHGCQELIVKCNIKNTSKLAKVFDLKKSVARILGLLPSALEIYDIKDGCVIVTFLIPASVADALFTPDIVFTPQQKDELQAASILWMECNDHHFQFNESQQVEEALNFEPQGMSGQVHYVKN